MKDFNDTQGNLAESIDFLKYLFEHWPDVAAKDRKIAELEWALKQAEGNRDVWRKYANDYFSKKEKLEAEIKELKEKPSYVTWPTIADQTHIDSLTQDLHEARRNCKEARETIENLDAHVARLSDSIKVKNDEITRLRRETGLKASALSARNEELDRKRATISQQQRDIVNRGNSITELQNSVRALVDDNAKLAAQNRRDEATISGFEVEIAALKAVIDELRSKPGDQEKKLNAEINRLVAQSARDADTITGLYGDLDESRKTQTEMREALGAIYQSTVFAKATSGLLMSADTYRLIDRIQERAAKYVK